MLITIGIAAESTAVMKRELSASGGEENDDDDSTPKRARVGPADRDGPDADTPFTVVNLNPDAPTSAPFDSIPSDEALLNIYPQLSNRNLHAYLPTVWDSNGRFTTEYIHLRQASRGTPPRTIPNKECLQWCQLFDKFFQCHPVVIPKKWTRIVIAITRSSGRSPVYGRGGMIERATTAGNAWIRLRPDDPALLVVHTRARVSSAAALDTPAAFIQEIRRLLGAASERPGTRVELLSVGIDAFTTNVSSLTWLGDEFSNLDITMVYVVQAEFPDTTRFPVHLNRVRYGTFSLRKILEEMNSDEETSRKVLGSILQLINAGKGGYGGLDYREWTRGRNGFRVCPESATESGIALTTPILSRSLR